MNEYAEVFALLAELGIALAGFTGIAAAFAGRARQYGSTELVRLVSLFLHSGMVFAGSGIAIALMQTDVSHSLIFRVVSSISLLFITLVGAPWLVRAYKFAKEPESTSEPWALHISSTQLVLLVALFGTGAISGSPQFLFFAYWLSLIYGLWMFSRLLTRAN